MKINEQEYRDKLMGCWMGKNIGHALGQPFQWKRKINDVTFYIQEDMPGTNLDLQLLWLRALEDNGVHTSTPILSEYFLSYTNIYGSAKVNMHTGLMPPLSSQAQPYRHSTGALARTEIWATISPGCPEIAATKTYHDAIIDHGAGEGLLAAIFMSAVQSSGFIQNDKFELIDIGLSYIPEDCGVAQAVSSVLDSYKQGKTWLEARDKVLQDHRGQHKDWEDAGISQRDWDYGLADGDEGYDAPSNIGMIIIGWLYGEDDFARSICTTVNCGEDTNTNAAALGALLGIINGLGQIPYDWAEPITTKISTKIIDIFNVKHIPRTLGELTTRIERLAKIIMLTYRPDVEFTNMLTSICQADLDRLPNPEMGEKILRNMYGPIYENSLITCALDYKSDGYIKPWNTAKIQLRIGCKLNHDLLLNIKWYLPQGFGIKPVSRGLLRCPGGGVQTPPYEFEIEAYGPVEIVNRFVIEITSPGRHTAVLVPVVLLDGGLM
ncbi:MAG: ADP-ribosylglycohydrolase family protein [Defluviitaleaceae bacterium]|nr:ADP-ribosylglycohydrolase family protein [Defluviitaleaceae bacterium]